MKTVITVKINDNIKKVIQDYCDDNNICLSDWLRQAIKNKIIEDNIIKTS
jgi:hypothetical protein